MKKIYFIPCFIFVVCVACQKNSGNSDNPAPAAPKTNDNGFVVFYDGTEYTGSVRFSGYPAPPPPGNKYKNIVAGYQIRDVNFGLTITNVPDSGTRNLCASGCDAAKGDAELSFTDIEINLSGFTGTVERVAPGTIKINAAKAGKIVTGTLQWK